MTLLVFIAVCGLGAVIGLAARPSGALVRLAGLACLAVAFVAALLIGPATRLAVGDVALGGSEYSGLFLACVAGSALLLGVVALASGWADEFVPAALAALAGIAIALTATDPGVALLSGAAAATAGALVVAGYGGSAGSTQRSPEGDGRLAEIRTIGLVAAGLGLAAIAILRPSWTGLSDGAVFGLAFLGLGGVLAVRGGAVPFHVPAARLHRTAVPMSPALLLVWVPASLGILAVGWSSATSGLRSDWLTTAGLAVQVVAVATLVLGPLAALVHDEMDEIAAYSIVADAGFVLLAMAARTDAAAEPARLWLVVFVAAKTGLVAWTAALSRAFGTSNLNRLRGWLRRTPLLGIALAVVVVATLGWPGSAVYEARSALIRLALPGWLQFLFAASIGLSLASYGRLLIVGLLSPADDVRAARSELPRWSAASAGPMDAPVEIPAAAEPSTSVEPVAAVAALASSPRSQRRLAAVWRLNRTLLVSLVVVLGAGLSVALAGGGMGASNASRFGIPFDTAAHATPTRMPTPTPSPTARPTAAPTFAPRPSSSASGSSTSGESPSPSVSPAPGKTSAPARGNTD